MPTNGTAFALLSLLRERIDERADPANEESYEGDGRLTVQPAAGGLRIWFHGDPFSHNYEDLCETLADPEVARSLVSLDLDGPDEGANGTRSWDLEPLAEVESFPRMQSLTIASTDPSHHNRTVVATEFEENGVLARLLDRMPNLGELRAPSAPTPAFLERDAVPLVSLSLDAGYDHQSFVQHLAESRCLPRLVNLEWGEYAETYMEDFADRTVPPDDYRALFASPLMQNLQRFVWRNPLFSDEEIRAMRPDRRDLQLLVVRTAGEYVG